MGEFVKVASTSQIPPGKGMTVQAGGKKIAVFNVGGIFHAIDDTCLHRGGPLGQGALSGSVVTCPWHGWQWDVTTGQSKANPAAKVGRYPVKVEGSDVKVQL
ncbi:MAG: Rieske 2Fe-2S domain-containing protein [Euryarchaeota archaeon]|nr:Rieske 2Fe-2S domain-containing protein [Euryarchaeota archaeon]